MPPGLPVSPVTVQEGWGPGFFDLLALTSWTVRLQYARSRRQRRRARQRALAALERYWAPRLLRRGIEGAGRQALIRAIWLGANLQGRLWARAVYESRHPLWRFLGRVVGWPTLTAAAVAYRSWKWTPPIALALPKRPSTLRTAP